MNSLSALLQPGQVVLDMQAASKAVLLHAIGEQVQAQLGLEAERVSRALDLRERAGSTGLGKAFAIPHARLAELEHPWVMYIRLAQGIEFGAVDGLPVTEVLVLLVPRPACQLHLDLLAEATRLFGCNAFRQRLAQCQHVEAVLHLIDTFKIDTIKMDSGKMDSGKMDSGKMDGDNMHTITADRAHSNPAKSPTGFKHGNKA